MNPTPKSPQQVLRDPNYQVMVGYIPNSYWPSADEIVVKHTESNTFWRAIYRLREDDDDGDLPTTWDQVVPETITTVKYKNV